jgi:hypothetical protein
VGTETRVAFSIIRERSREIISSVGSNRTVEDLLGCEQPVDHHRKHRQLGRANRVGCSW